MAAFAMSFVSVRFERSREPFVSMCLDYARHER
jgi:hypothetical protein